MLVAVIVGAVLVLAVVAGTPMHCQGQTSKPPFRGCKIIVYGIFGRCRIHRLQPRRRMIAVLGGQKLLLRRVCISCGLPSVFCRARDTGKPFLGCSGFPSCKKPRWLGG